MFSALSEDDWNLIVKWFEDQILVDGLIYLPRTEPTKVAVQTDNDGVNRISAKDGATGLFKVGGGMSNGTPNGVEGVKGVDEQQKTTNKISSLDTDLKNGYLYLVYSSIKTSIPVINITGLINLLTMKWTF